MKRLKAAAFIFAIALPRMMWIALCMSCSASVTAWKALSPKAPPPQSAQPEGTAAAVVIALPPPTWPAVVTTADGPIDVRWQPVEYQRLFFLHGWLRYSRLALRTPAHEYEAPEC